MAQLVDLRSYQQGGNGGAKVLQVMGQLVEHTANLIQASVGEEKKKHQFRLTQFRKAISTLKGCSQEITSGRQARELPGIGKGIGDRIDEILRTGTLAELNVEKPVDETTRIINELTTVTGIGEANAKKFVEMGVKGVDDLRTKVATGSVRLTHHMQIGLKYYNDFQQKIPYAEVAEIGMSLKQCVAHIYPQIKVEICGSHRRQKPLSGDIDILMTVPQLVTEDDLIRAKIPYLKEIVKVLKGHGVIVDDLTTQGDTKYMGVCIHPLTKVGRRIDIRLVTYDSFYPALLYFTGSMMLNKLMRTVAIEKHYTLNEYGLFKTVANSKEEKILVFSEKDIFDRLGLVYLTPPEREIN